MALLRMPDSKRGRITREIKKSIALATLLFFRKNLKILITGVMYTQKIIIIITGVMYTQKIIIIITGVMRPENSNTNYSRA